MGRIQNLPHDSLEEIEKNAAPCEPTSSGKVYADNLTDRVAPGCQKKIWVDIDNSPHVPFFIPIIQELSDASHSEVVLMGLGLPGDLIHGGR